MSRRTVEITQAEGWVQISNRPAVITITGVSAQAGSSMAFNDQPSEIGAELVTSFNLYQQLIQPERKITYAKVIKSETSMKVIVDD